MTSHTTESTLMDQSHRGMLEALCAAGIEVLNYGSLILIDCPNPDHVEGYPCCAYLSGTSQFHCGICGWSGQLSDVLEQVNVDQKK
ncbi:hypothetical protein [Sulfuriroseicoccus oceanibius]|uniref:Uncharacterized protein n=1 Tax=Sulfuriroseicoccus oceanibius TaxID=2707525 RepID=A0A6B3L1X6_9BACT|nr:hypothetical protein [Sulfuriroseicoccus oceanibius]QQL43707.1 hypothetical protein G3M56_007285 [Sulfuriroseicoccus oceanibius]